MRKIISIILMLAICLSLAACSVGSDSKLTAEEAIIGKWIYNTGFTTWNFVFNTDMTCSYWSGAREPNLSKYKMENGEIVIEGLDWKLYYELLDGKMKFWQDTPHDDGSRSTWEFTKDTTYNPSDITSLALTDIMVDEIEEKYTASSFTAVLLAYLTLNYKELEFTDWEVTKAKKADPYTYVVYGVLYAKDNYGQKYRQNANVIFTAVNDTTESGYSIKWNVELIK